MSGEESPAFEAGVAAATAANAAEDAQEAQETAEAAEATAEVAVAVAERASDTAWAAQADVDSLRDEVRTGFADLKEILSAGSKGPTDDGPPAPEPKIKSETPPATDDHAPEQEKPAKSKQGLGVWR